MSKWNLLFEKSTEWMAFKPQPGWKAYPCYSCRNIFSSKLTFQDHINRRVITIKYKCTFCSNTLTFYNRCSFLLHARKHYPINGGQINLANVEIYLLPPELAGFSYHEAVPYLYNEEEEYITDNTNMNTQFYSADENDVGKQIINIQPHNLTFSYKDTDKEILLILKQIASNLPLCKFVEQEDNGPTEIVENKSPNNEPAAIIPDIKQEKNNPEDYPLPIISKIESLSEIAIVKRRPICPECSKPQDVPMAVHFSGSNKPLDENLCCFICKYIAPTKCSLFAHKRTHHHLAPFVCPECGKTFKDTDSLTTHMDDICFHTAKQLRFRCPAFKCGKIFVVFNTFVAHFSNHIQATQQCDVCSAVFFKEPEFAEHAKMHISCSPIKRYSCMVCRDVPLLTDNDYDEHIKFHVNSRERCVYIYTCRTCRSYFRSTSTYIVHKIRCAKNEKFSATPIIIGTCSYCSQKITFRDSDTYKTCITCKQINYHPNSNATKQTDPKKSVCLLCKEDVLDEDRQVHDAACKYHNPVVSVEVVSSENETNDKWDDTSSERLNHSNSDGENRTNCEDNLGCLEKHNEENRKKRKRSNGNNSKNKKNSFQIATNNLELQAERPHIFDGIYRCKLCKFENNHRDAFHKHIVIHRDISTAYQCMECGECFVVKPSLLKHLLHYHKIEDTNAYLLKNDCYDKEAIEELEHQLKLAPGEHKFPVNKHQCTVCLKQCENDIELKTHFRIHGMAFLLKNT